MTDAPAPRQPSGETLPPAEDETRFAPKENGGEHKDENSAPAAKKRLKTSLDVVSGTRCGRRIRPAGGFRTESQGRRSFLEPLPGAVRPYRHQCRLYCL